MTIPIQRICELYIGVKYCPTPITIPSNDKHNEY